MNNDGVSKPSATVSVDLNRLIVDGYLLQLELF